MTGPAVLPALLVAHDPLSQAAIGRAQWIVEGAGLTLLGCAADEYTPSLARQALSEVGAYDAFLVVHVIGPLADPGLSVAERGDDPVGALVDALTSVHRSLGESFPGKKRIDQWVIHTVGQIIDAEEEEFIRHVATTGAPGLRGVIVSASATHASVTHDDAEQASFAADVILALAGSNLEEQLAHAEPMIWVAGVSSVAYAGVRVGAAVSAHHAIRVLDDHLLSEPPAGDPAFDMGEMWVEDLDLPAPQEREVLLGSPSSGSLLSRVRMDEIDWGSVPITSWTDVLTTQQQLIAAQEFDGVRGVIEKNRRERLEELQRGVIAGAFDELESSARLESALTFARGVQSGLEKAVQKLSEPRTEVDSEDVNRDRDKLRHFTRWLPFGPAVALRVFAVALGALVVVATSTGPSDLPVLQSFTKPWGRVAALVVVLAGFLLYQRRLQSTLRVRDRLNKALERQLVDTVEQWVAEARRKTLAELRAWIGSRPSWLDRPPAPERPEEAETLAEWFGWLIQESRCIRDDLVVRAEDRRDPAGLVSRHAIDLPATASITTSELAEQLLDHPPEAHEGARTLAVSVRRQCQPEGLRTPTRSQLDSLWANWLLNRLGPHLWHDLGELLKDRPSVRDSARRTIEANTTPAIESAGNAPTIGTRHYLAVAGGRTGSAFAQLFSPDIEVSSLPAARVSDALTDVLDFGIRDVAIMVHLYALELGAPAQATSERHRQGGSPDGTSVESQ